MCLLCGIWGGRQHWGESGRSGPSSRPERRLREQLLGRIVSHYRLQLKPWSGEGYLICGHGGPTQLAENLSALWAVVERASGVKCDPLAPELLDSLRGEDASR